MLQVTVANGVLELVYPSEGRFDFAGVVRVYLFARRRGLKPRLEWWGSMFAVRAVVGEDVEHAIGLIDSYYRLVLRIPDPYVLKFHRMGWASTEPQLDRPD